MLHHLEVFLAGAAFGAGPVHRHVGPGVSRRDAVFGVTRGLVVDPAADQAHPGTRFAHGGRLGHYNEQDCSHGIGQKLKEM
jgi:hypothetical protein